MSDLWRNDQALFAPIRQELFTEVVGDVLAAANSAP